MKRYGAQAWFVVFSVIGIVLCVQHWLGTNSQKPNDFFIPILFAAGVIGVTGQGVFSYLSVKHKHDSHGSHDLPYFLGFVYTLVLLGISAIAMSSGKITPEELPKVIGTHFALSLFFTGLGIITRVITAKVIDTFKEKTQKPDPQRDIMELIGSQMHAFELQCTAVLRELQESKEKFSNANIESINQAKSAAEELAKFNQDLIENSRAYWNSQKEHAITLGEVLFPSNRISEIKKAYDSLSKGLTSTGECAEITTKKMYTLADLMTKMNAATTESISQMNGLAKKLETSETASTKFSNSLENCSNAVNLNIKQTGILTDISNKAASFVLKFGEATNQSSNNLTQFISTSLECSKAIQILNQHTRGAAESISKQSENITTLTSATLAAESGINNLNNTASHTANTSLRNFATSLQEVEKVLKNLPSTIERQA